MERSFKIVFTLLVGLSLFWSVEALPRFHTVNGRYYNGTTCPAVTKYNVRCPVLCVTNTSDCPTAVGPQSCPTGQSLCGDGSCRGDCHGVVNICSCPSQPGIVLQACRASQVVDIPHYDTSNANTQTYQACAAALNVPTGYPTWADIQPAASSKFSVWNVCAPPAGINFPTKAPFMISFFAMYFPFFIFLGLWTLYKRYREKPFDHQSSELIDPVELLDVDPSAKEKEKVTETAESEVSEEDLSETLVLKGYCNDWFGNLMVSYLTLASIGWTIFLLVISLDYYGYVNGIPYGLFYDSYDLSSKAFCLIWFLSTAWYLVLNLLRSKLRNFFRIRHSLDVATVVQIEKPRQVLHMLNAGGSDASPALQRLQSIESAIRRHLKFDMFIVTSPVHRTTLKHRYFEFQSTRYMFNTRLCTFEPSSIDLGTDPAHLLKMQAGLSMETANERMEMLGPNFIAVQVPHFVQALWEELTGFFYIYQIMILWCYFYLAYWQIGVSDTGVILLAAIIKVIVRLRSEYRIKAMAEHVDTCTVLRDGEWIEESTAELVPGDVFKALSGQVVPADAVVLRGDIVVDESSLTGEPLPIRKFPLRDDGQPYDRQVAGKIQSLFAGTTIKQASSSAVALVLETRTNTDKGQLVQKILYPQPVSFIFHEQLKLVFCILLCYALFLLGIGSWWLGGTGMTAWFYGTICAAQVMNPLLPAILVVGQSVAAGRLKRKGIFCVDLSRILMAGKVQVFCFDKTGTLTREGLEYYGAYPAEQAQFGDFKADYQALQTENPTDHVLQLGIASCHSVTTLGSEYIGNPVDIVMFQATQATLGNTENDDIIRLAIEKPGQMSNEVQVIQRFEFQHARASMSVAILDRATGHVHVFCKGSFERIQELSRPDSIPSDFSQRTSHLAREGCYVLAMAHRDLGRDVDIDAVKNWTRDQLESHLSFVGLVLFKNLLKPDTADAIRQLKEGDTRTVMITGDNALTGVFIGQACGLVPSQARVAVGDVIDHDKDHIVWVDAETNKPVDIDKSLADPNTSLELAVTGRAFRLLVAQERMRDYLFCTRIFARMTPVDKMACVELFMERAITAMCGDGGNDCGALRSAHVGIAMSEAEASVVSPFSTPKRSVQSCVDLLIEGRAALATSFASYKYLIMYGETMATVKFLTFYYTMSFSQWNFILVDAFITVFCAIAVTQAGAASKLSYHRPTAQILGPEVLLSVVGQLFINIWFLVGAYIWLYTRDDFFRCHEWDARATDASKWWLLGDSFEADVLTFISLYQFVNAALIFNYGYTFRKRWYHNYMLIFFWSLFVAIVSFWELADPNAFGCLVRLNCGNPDVLVSLGYPRPDFYIEPYNNPLGHNVLPKPFRYQLWAYSIGNMIATNAWELLVILGPVRSWLRRRYPLQRLKIRN
ncbi:uncharacterized protein BYT42DRAFT_568700 [Radiomyces spectabilis]|uniref:uncharacterized protein n=1 Tax=Radiomyces spectabilis TaxID=64574 RepID=UPI00221F5690|nr:uncharacterized protein BYT42DRAFT_568700 [Radiomyces spectabilis]KAI8379410.1 hypothetical protein BYT42DRAFT_568700 [Radiomyces spectabilis]